MRIGILRDETIVNPLYRTIIPMQALADRGHEIVSDGKRSASFDMQRLLACDVVHVHRYYDRDVQRLVRQLADAGIGIWWDNDDDIVAAPRGTAAYRELGGRRGAEVFSGMCRMMGFADLVTTPSENLAAQYRRVTKTPVDVLENYVPHAFLREPKAGRSDRVTIGWVAGAEHVADARELGLEMVLQQLIDEVPSVGVVTVGLRLGLRVRYRHIRGVQLSELCETAAREFDIGIAPIADMPLNRSRSNIKVKEYAAAGLPWLASPVGPYMTLGERQGGRLAVPTRWREEIERLVHAPRERRKLSKRARKWAGGETIEANIDRWEHALERVLANARERRAA